MKRIYSTHNAKADALINQLVDTFEGNEDAKLLKEMLTSVYRMGEDQSATGDLKIINSALKELQFAFRLYRPYRDLRKVCVFGSARLKEDHPAYQEAKKFGKLMADAGWGVITGAASGIMRAGHEGAGAEASFGLNIRLPFEQEANPVIAEDDKLVNCKYFFTRKLLFIKESHATTLFAGGFGTLDEGFESLTLVQTGKSDPRPIVFVDVEGNHFWTELLAYLKSMVEKGVISEGDLSLYQLAHSAEDACEILKNFYSTYHSIRYVREILSVRLSKRLSEESVDLLNQEFSDILTSGKIEQGVALPEESDEPALQEYPRLIMNFDRRSYGRFINLIERINRLGA